MTTIARSINFNNIIDVIRRNPEFAKYAALSVALLVGRGIAALVHRHVAKHTVLEIDLDDSIREHPNQVKFFGDYYSLQELIDTIEFAKTDKRVVALLVKLKPNMTIQMAQIQELRDCIERFRLVGKLTVVYTETFGELTNATSMFYLATAFNFIYIQQSGGVCLAGPCADVPFVRNTLRKIGVVPEISHRKLYKSAAYLFTEENLNPNHREMMESLLKDLYSQIVVGIAEGRRISEDLVKTKMLKGIIESTDALDGLVDGARYQDEVYRSVLDHLKIGKANFLLWNKYRGKTGGKFGKKSKNLIALIYATGNIHRGPNQHSDFNSQNPSIGSDSLCAVLRTVTKDKRVKAIVLRVDSGGGSYVASDTIYHEVLAAKNAGKKVVVSMANVAASGGYFISMAADHIVAEPGTLTGSIGVLLGKFVTREMWEKLGVTHDDIKLRMSNDEDDNGIYNDWYSTLHSYEKEEYIKKREDVLDFIYDDFTKKVAFSRKLNREQVEAAAQGRVWTGRQALELGLIDKLGGLEEAIQMAKVLCEMPITATPYVQVYPKVSLKNFLKSPKNREEADTMGHVRSGIYDVIESASLLSNVAKKANGLLNIFAPHLSFSSSSLVSPLSATTTNLGL